MCLLEVSAIHSYIYTCTPTHVRTKIDSSRKGSRAKFQFLVLKNFKIWHCAKNYKYPSEARSKILKKIIFLIIKNRIFKNTWAIYAIFWT